MLTGSVSSRVCPSSFKPISYIRKPEPESTDMPPKKGAKASSSRVTALPATYTGKIGGKGLEQPQWGACRAMLEGVYIAKNGS